MALESITVNGEKISVHYATRKLQSLIILSLCLENSEVNVKFIATCHFDAGTPQAVQGSAAVGVAHCKRYTVDTCHRDFPVIVWYTIDFGFDIIILINRKEIS